MEPIPATVETINGQMPDTLADKEVPRSLNEPNINYLKPLSTEIHLLRLGLILSCRGGETINIGKDEVKVYGLGLFDFSTKRNLERELTKQNADRETSINQLGIKAIYLGSRRDFDDSIPENSAGFTSDEQGRVVIFKEALRNDRDISSAIYSLLAASSITIENAEDIGMRTFAIAKGLSLNEEMPKLGDRPLVMHAEIGKDTNFKGVYIRKYAGGKGLSAHEAFEAGAPYIDVGSGVLNRAYLAVRSNKFLKQFVGTAEPVSEFAVLEAALKYTKKTMPYNKGADEEVVSKCRELQAEGRSLLTPEGCVPFFLYVHKGVIGGVCSHMAIDVGLLLRAAKKEGLLTGSISFERVTYGDSVAHAGVRYTEKNNQRAFILDPAQQESVLELGTPGTSLFLRNSDRMRIRETARVF